MSTRKPATPAGSPGPYALAVGHGIHHPGNRARRDGFPDHNAPFDDAPSGQPDHSGSASEPERPPLCR